MTKGKHHVIIHTFVIFRSVRFLLNVSVVLVIAVKRRRRTFKKHVRISNSWKETINEPELSGKTGTNNNFIKIIIKVLFYIFVIHLFFIWKEFL